MPKNVALYLSDSSSGTQYTVNGWKLFPIEVHIDYILKTIAAHYTENNVFELAQNIHYL